MRLTIILDKLLQLCFNFFDLNLALFHAFFSPSVFLSRIETHSSTFWEKINLVTMFAIINLVFSLVNLICVITKIRNGDIIVIRLKWRRWIGINLNECFCQGTIPIVKLLKSELKTTTFRLLKEKGCPRQ